MNKKEFNNLNKKLKLNLNLIELYKKANAGHIAASLSCIDLLQYLYFKVMNNDDNFILSKGHAALALYVTLAEKGIISQDELASFYKDGTFLAAHPPCGGKVKGIPFGTGSLGHGLSLAVGYALAFKLKNKSSKSFCILSDGDCNEGSTWEAALFAAQRKLSNLIVIIDRNGLQGFGHTKDVIDLEPLHDKWKSFGFDVYNIQNGNKFEDIDKVFNEIKTTNKPICVIAQTTKGHSISFMENKMEWHYLPLSDEQYKQAIKEITEK